MKLILIDISLKINPQAFHEVTFHDLSRLNINNCVGCFGCWTKTPGKCVIRDDAPKIYPLIAQSEKVMYVSHIKYGSYDTLMKKMLERAIPIQKAFIRLLANETHHVQRNVLPKEAKIIAYAEDISDNEKKIFTSLVARNAHNMNFKSYEVIFTNCQDLDKIVNKELTKWEIS